MTDGTVLIGLVAFVSTALVGATQWYWATTIKRLILVSAMQLVAAFLVPAIVALLSADPGAPFVALILSFGILISLALNLFSGIFLAFRLNKMKG